MLPEHAKTMWPKVEDVLRSPDVTAWQQALMNNLHSSDGFRVLSLDGTMKIAMGLRRYETRIPRPAEGIVDGGVDDNSCVLTIRTLEGGLLNLAVVPNDSHWRARSGLINGVACVGWSWTTRLPHCVPRC